jgi:diguanylate cyclase (GGDEF)-like protein
MIISPQGVLRSLLHGVKVPREQVMSLLTPLHHAGHIRRHVAAVTISRVRLVSTVFALLVPLWSVIDWAIFDWPEWAYMTALRLLSAVVFLALARRREVSSLWPYLQARSLLMIMLLVPPVFYLASAQVVEGLHLDGGMSLLMQLYGLLPSIVLAGLAIFPLTALEVILFSLPALACFGLGLQMSGQTVTLAEHGPAVWFMGLTIGVSMFSGMTQLHYMTTLVNKAMSDPLTGAYTRRSGGEALDLLFRLSTMSGKPLTIAFFDLDHFKSINDTYGHEAGDEALRAMVDRLRQGLRRGDHVVRWGGEEFLAVLPDMPTDGVEVLLRRLRETGFGRRPDGAPLTASIGIAERMDDGATVWDDLVELADQRMYEAKRSGRDRAVLPGRRAIVFGETPPDDPVAGEKTVPV